MMVRVIVLFVICFGIGSPWKLFSEEVLVNSLESLVFTEDFSSVKKDLNKKGVVVTNLMVPNLKSFQQRMERFLHKSLTLSLIEEIRKEVVIYYREQEYPLVDTLIPAPQDVTEGRLVIVVLMGHLGNVRVEGCSASTAKRLAKCLRTDPGALINTKTMIDDLNWLNKNPFRSVDMIYEKGEKLSSTDILLKVQEKKSYRLYAGYENSGYQIAGDSRLVCGFNLGNLWSQDHQLNGQFVTAIDPHKLWSFSGNYIAPLPWRDTLEVFGNYVHSHEDLHDKYDTLPRESNANGFTYQISGRYHFALPRIKKYNHELIVGYDFKRMNNFLTYALIPVYSKDIDISQFLLRYESKLYDRYGFSAIGASLFLSPGYMTAYNKNSYFALERPGATAAYVYGVINFDRFFCLAKDCSFVINGLAQITGSKLMPSEEISLGGQFSIRGYKENAIIGDRGFLLKNEFRSCPFRVFFRNKVKDELTLLAFLDLGVTASADKNITPHETQFLLSVGPGLRYSIKDYVNIRLDYGIQLHRIEDLQIGKPGHGRLHAGVFIGF